ncbi:hypothetical protein Dip518_000081 [Parelusimicrobium proximum]|uniref:lipoyl protein ligase domain-containing protein n=1 Tax=Parelusimicrobium proximum TaxID=3228953 RepID=UPI003D165798
MKGFLISTSAFDVYEHMSFDESLAVSSAGLGDVYLRFYNWKDNSPSATFGYAQFFCQVDRELKREGDIISVTRRPTGGGIVLHRDDITFSLVFPVQKKSVREIYSLFHNTINRELSGIKHNFNVLSTPSSAEAYAPSSGGRPARVLCVL